MAVKPIPEGYHAVTPYLVVSDAAREIRFLEQAFGAEVLFRMPGEDGRIRHAELRIRDSVLMLADATDRYAARPAMFHLYVEDVDAVFERAVAAGGTVERRPENQFYGDRTAGVADPCGNAWYIATHVEDVSPEELKRRVQANPSALS